MAPLKNRSDAARRDYAAGRFRGWAVILIVAGILSVVIGWGDSRRRLAIWNDAVAASGQYVRANHMSLSRGRVVYLTADGKRHSFTPPFFGRLPTEESIAIEYRKSDPDNGWLAASPPYEMTNPALLMFFGGECLVAAAVLLLMPRRVGNARLTNPRSAVGTSDSTASVQAPLDRKKRILIGAAGVSLLLFGVAVWCGSGPGPVPPVVPIAAPGQLGNAAAAAMQNPVRDSFEQEPEDELPLESVVTLKEFDESWRTDLEIKDKPAGEVLERLCIDCGLQLDRRGRWFEEYAEMQETLNRRVSVKLRQQSRLAAIEDVCRQIGLIPEYSIRKLGLIPAVQEFQQRLPVTYAGPFLVEITGIGADEKTGSGNVNLRLIAANLPEAAIARLRRTADPRYPHLHDPVELELLSATGPMGEVLTDGRTYGRRDVTATRSMLIIRETFLLKNLTQSVTALSLRGRFAFALPASVQVLTFESPRAGDTVTQNGTTAEVLTWRTSESFSSLVLEATGVEPRRVAVIGRGASLLKPSMSQRDTMPNAPDGSPRCRIHESFKGEPSTLEVRGIDRVEPVELPFEITNVPLRDAKKMPAKIVPFAFEGDRPLALKVVSIKSEVSGYPVPSAQVVLETTNLANWPLKNGKARFLFTDADGKVVTVREWPFRCDRRNELPPQQTRNFSLSVQSVSKNAVAATVELIEAEFADGTLWVAPKE